MQNIKTADFTLVQCCHCSIETVAELYSVKHPSALKIIIVLRSCERQPGKRPTFNEVKPVAFKFVNNEKQRARNDHLPCCC